MGRVGATAITCTHRCRLFCFCFVLFDCCVSLLLPSIHDDICEFLVTFGKGERGGVFFIPLSSLKIVDSIYASQHCVAFVLGATQTKKNYFSRKKNSSKNCRLCLHQPALCSFSTRGYTNLKKISLVAKKFVC